MPRGQRTEINQVHCPMKVGPPGPEGDRMNVKTVSKLVILVFSLSVLSACAAVMVGGAAGATYTYIKGWLVKDYDANLKITYRAAVKAVKYHDLKIIDKGKDLTIAYVKAKGAKREITVRLKRKGKFLTKVSIRVGVMGDRKAAEMIHNSIRGYL